MAVPAYLAAFGLGGGKPYQSKSQAAGHRRSNVSPAFSKAAGAGRSPLPPAGGLHKNIPIQITGGMSYEHH